MVYLPLFVAVALLEVLSALLIFVFKDILHAVLALSAMFIFNSAIFLVLAQPLLALLQLFIMVGGVSTYAFVGVAAGSYSRFKHTDLLVFAGLVIIVTLTIYLKAGQAGVTASQQNTISKNLIAITLSNDAGMLYMATALLFGTGLGSIILMRKLGDRR
jgi:NADH:ubiquinone oxidoreductase subunit 6 (subunit J)